MEHELEALKTEFAEYKTKQEADCKREIDSLKELIHDLRRDVGEIMLMHNGQEEDLNSRLDRHRFDINQLREDHNSLKEDDQELEAEAAALRFVLATCRIDCAIVLIVATRLSLQLVPQLFPLFPPLLSIPQSSILQV